MAVPKTAVVTGAASGIGFECAVRLIGDGYQVVGVDQNADGLQKLATRFKATSLSIVVADLTSESATGRVQQLLGDRRIAALISCAGMDDGGAPIEEMTVDRWRRLLDINLTSHFLITRALIPFFDRGGMIIYVSSIAGLIGSSGKSAYAAAKAGLIGLARALAIEKAPAGIRVNVICPGLVDTPMLRSAFPESVPPKLMGMVPLGTLGDPRDIAACAAFLCSQSGAYFTGSVLTIDGGWTAQ